MPDLPEGTICHLTPNRVRIRVPARRHDAAFFDAVREKLGAWDSVDRVEVNPMTASILIHYSDAAALFLEHTLQNDFFALAELTPAQEAMMQAEPSGEPIVERARRGFDGFDHEMRQLSSGSADLRSLVFLGLVGTGIVQLLRGNIAVPALTLFWYAGDMLRLWQGDDRAAASVTDGRTQTGAERRI